MKYFVISDIHSYFHEMDTALRIAGFNKENKEHIIISCGDAFDRGPDSEKILEFFLDMYDQHRAIFVKGNHEELMVDAMRRGFFKGHDIHNCTPDTAKQLTHIEDSDEALRAMESLESWNRYYNACVDYYEIADYIFVHGWIPIDYEREETDVFKDLPALYAPVKQIYDPDWRDSIYWSEARWANGMNLWSKGIKEPGKTIVCGHWHTSWGHCRLHDDGVEWLNSIETSYIDPETGKQEPHINTDIFYDDGIIALDACTAISHKVNVYTFEV